MARDDELELLATELVRTLGGTGSVVLEPIRSGRNNRGYRARLGERSYFLKSYFRHPADPRERARTEWSFARYAWGTGARSLPEPLVADLEHDLVLFEWIEGPRLEPRTVTAEHVEQALDLVAALDAHRDEASDLPDASEACFSLAEHLARVDARIERLDAIEPEDPASESAARFAAARLLPAWQRIREGATVRARGEVLALEEVLPVSERIPSPSDFGFHNAIVDPRGRLRFVDFEYAGWDDPAKLACDFLCQPEIPAPPSTHERVLERVSSLRCDAARHRARIEILRPVYHVKWACMLLNEFLPTHRERRTFADPEAIERRGRQIEKAELMLRGAERRGSP